MDFADSRSLAYGHFFYHTFDVFLLYMKTLFGFWSN